MGIDTIQVQSDVESPFTSDEIPYISGNGIRKTPTGHYLYRLNPDKANSNIGIYDSVTYYTVCDFMIKALQLKNPVKIRIDFRFDSFEDNFNDLLKLNTLLELLLDKQYNLSNRYKSNDPLTFDELTIRVQNRRLEVENYNKGIQEPDGKVKNRLELRSKALQLIGNEQEKEYTEFKKWCDRLGIAVNKINFDELINELSVTLYN